MNRPVGSVTRGTTSARRLRAVDRWLVATHPGLLARPRLLVVDLGFGAEPVTTVELARRLRRMNPTAHVTGLEIDPTRVAAANRHAAPGLSFGYGGFELGGLRPDVVRAFNVLRQYNEGDVPAAWQAMTAALRDTGGLALDGTCDESGRLGSWVTLRATGPASLTLLVDLHRPPSAVAARLPKALIHHNVPGEAIHALLAELDAHWRGAAPLGVFSPRQRFVETVRRLAMRDWPVLDGPARWRRGELTVPWTRVEPAARPTATMTDTAACPR